eukprot:1191706-Pleurochrysis_carterae.AAC.1
MLICDGGVIFSSLLSLSCCTGSMPTYCFRPRSKHQRNHLSSSTNAVSEEGCEETSVVPWLVGHNSAVEAHDIDAVAALNPCC